MSRIFHELLATDRVLRVFSVSRIVHPVVFDVFGMAGGFDGPLYVECVGGEAREDVDRDIAFTLGYVRGILAAMK